MRILQVIASLQKAAGTSTFCGEVSNQLIVCGHEVVIATCNPSEDDCVSLNPKIRCCSVHSLLLKKGYLLRKACFSLVHIHGLWTLDLNRVFRVAYANGISVVWSTHGMTLPWAMRHKRWKKLLPWYLYQRRDLLRAALVHCTVDAEARWNAALGFRRNVVVPLGTYLPEDWDLHHKQQVRASHTLLFVGRIYPVKAIDNLIRAFQSISHTGWRLRIVGPDQAGHMSELRLIAREDVDFVGPKYDEALEAEYWGCDCLALVSHTENFGATVVDALAHGKPVITGTKTPWQIVAEKGCGWWVDNKIESLAKAVGEMMALSDDERRAMGESGRQLVKEKYTWKAVCDAMVEGYRRILAGNRSAV